MSAEQSMQDTLNSVTTELTSLETRIRADTERADALRQVKSGLEKYLTMGSPGGSEVVADETFVFRSPPTTGPRGREAVRRVLQDAAGAPMDIAHIAQEIERRGWIEPQANVVDAVRTSLLRAVKKWPEIQRVGHGVYVYGDPNHDGPTEAGPSS